MKQNMGRISEVRPKLIRRKCGGWLAVCPSKAGLSLGVTAITEQEARDEFRFVLARWLEILALKTLDVPK